MTSQDASLNLKHSYGVVSCMFGIIFQIKEIYDICQVNTLHPSEHTHRKQKRNM